MLKMNILLVNPGVEDRSKLVGRYARFLTPVLPQGLAYLGTVLKHAGHRVAIEDQFATGATHLELVERIIREKIDLVGIGSLTTLQHEAQSLTRLIKKRAPHVVVVFGNIHATLFAERTLRETGADYVVHGEGEETLRDLVDAIARGTPVRSVAGITFLENDAAVFTGDRPPIADLDALPFPDWKMFDVSHYQPAFFMRKRAPVIPLLITRGCAYRCTFCSQIAIFSGGVRKRSIKNVVDEIEDCVVNYGYTHFGLNDAIFPYNDRQMFELADELIRRGLHRKIVWFTEMRIDLITRPMLQAMRDSGCYLLMLGIESGDDHVLKVNQKRQKVAEIREKAKLIAESGMETLGLFVLGLPGETLASAQRTIDLARDLPLTFAKFNRATPYPGSELYDEWVKADPARANFDWEKFSAWAPPESSKDVLYTPEGVSAAQLARLQNTAVRNFYLKPARIRRLISQRLISVSTMMEGAQIIGGGVFDQMTFDMPPLLATPTQVPARRLPL